MDRPTTGTDVHAQGSRPGPHEAFVLPSRRPGLDLCRATIRSSTGSGTGSSTGRGPILLTGEAGVGKTWLWKQLQAESTPSWRWIGVDLTPTDDPADFYRLIAHELGLVETSTTRASRVDLVDFLAERQADGERLVLVVEEAHNVSMPVWEEVRVLANRLEQPGGFLGTLLVGQTSLARRFATRPFASIEARLACRIHLGPIDVDEARELLTRLRPGRDWPVHEVEILHRDAAGNPRRMLRKLGPFSAPSATPSPSIATKSAQTEPTKLAAPTGPIQIRARPAVQVANSVSLTGPTRPPIQVDDNMIEVGWSPDDSLGLGEAELESDTGQSTNSLTSTASGEETARDHYAALQAWQDWSDNQTRRNPPAANLEGREAGSDSEDPPESDEEDEELEEEDDSVPPARTDRANVRAEGEQKFAPFGQLFSRMAQVREPE